MTSHDHEGIIEFVEIAARLKKLRRQGWIDRGAREPESVADHSWAVALLAWLLAAGRDDLDVGRVALLALVHDLPEALAGDETPFDRHRDERGVIPPEHFERAPVYDPSGAKKTRERAALERMLSSLPGRQAALVRDAWEEYSQGETAEAVFVKQVDKIETLLQAELYLSEQPELVIESFRSGTARDVNDADLREIVREILRRGTSDAGLAKDENPE